MKYLFLVFCVHFGILVSSICGQVLSPGGSIRVPPESRVPISSRTLRRINEINRRTQARDDLQREIIPEGQPNLKTKIPHKVKEGLKISDDDEKELSLNFKSGKPRFIKIWNDICGGEKSFNANDENCLEKVDFSIVSVYSFYLKDYKDYFADIEVVDNKLIAASNGEFQMLTKAVDVAFDDVGEETKQVKTLNSFDLLKVDLQKAAKAFESGFQFYDIEIKTSVGIETNQTYLLRSVFDDNNLSSGFTRVDKIFAFQIFKANKGFLMVAWKEIKLKK
jgi:hypothetical protein